MPRLPARPHLVVVHGEWPGLRAGRLRGAGGTHRDLDSGGITIVAFAVDSGDGSAPGAMDPFTPILDASCTVRLVEITARELAAYREGFASQGVWPGRTPGAVYQPDDYRIYCHVNRRAADAVCASVRGPTWVFIEDHHLALVPQMVRQACAHDVFLVARWPVPWPSDGAVDRRPWGLAILEGLLGADLLLMATPRERRHFLESARDYCGAHPNEAQGALVYDGRRVSVLLDRPEAEVPPFESTRDGRHHQGAARRW